jgi:hypothetical protein
MNSGKVWKEILENSGKNELRKGVEGKIPESMNSKKARKEIPENFRKVRTPERGERKFRKIPKSMISKGKLWPKEVSERFKKDLGRFGEFSRYFVVSTMGFDAFNSLILQSIGIIVVRVNSRRKVAHVKTNIFSVAFFENCWRKTMITWYGNLRNAPESYYYLHCTIICNGRVFNRNNKGF